jgi:hypothetical protein
MFLDSKWEDHVVAGIPQFPESCTLKKKRQVLLKHQHIQTKLHNVTHYYSPSQEP